MELLLWLWVILVPFLLGKGAMRILYRKEDRACPDRGNAGSGFWCCALCTGLCLEICFMEAAHLAAVFWDCSLTRIAWCWGAVCFLCALLSLCRELVPLWRKRKRKFRRGGRRGNALQGSARRGKVLQESGRERKDGQEPPYTGAQQFLVIVFGLSVLLQLVLLLSGRIVWWDGDMTLETVQSFLHTDAVYRVNPLTGGAYEAGMPLRVRILSLPSLYASLCRLFSVSPLLVIGKVIPAAVLMAAYCVYGELGKALFPEDRSKRWIFLLIVSILIWAGDYRTEMDGFQLLHCGYRGTAIRAGILLPGTLCMCLRGRWKTVLLCIAAEACMVWTFYGLGACLLTAALYGLVCLINRWRRKRGGRA